MSASASRPMSRREPDRGEVMEYVLTIMVLIAIFVILSSSYNLIIGYGGLATVAHPIFYALGAYTVPLLAIHLGLPAVVCVIAGALVAARRIDPPGPIGLAGFGRLSVDRQPRIPARPAAGHQELRVHRWARRPFRDSEPRSPGRGGRLHIWRSPAVVAILSVWLISLYRTWPLWTCDHCHAGRRAGVFGARARRHVA